MKSGDIKNKKQGMLSGFTALGAAGIINKILSVLYVPLLTVFLGNEGNAIYNAGYQIYAFVFVITSNGIPIALSKLISSQEALGRYTDARKTFRSAAILITAIGTGAALLMALFAQPLARMINRPEAYYTILALSPTLIFTSVSSAIRGYFQGRSVMTFTGTSQILEQFINSVFTILFAYLMVKFGQSSAAAQGLTGDAATLYAVTLGAAGGTVGTSLGAAASAVFLGGRYLHYRPQFLLESQSNGGYAPSTGKEILKDILVIALPIMIGSTLVNAANLVDLGLTNGRLLAAGFTEAETRSLYGILSTQFQKVITIPLSIITALAAAVIPQISAAYTKRSKKKLVSGVQLAYKSLYYITLPATVGLFVLANPVIYMLFPTAPQGADLMRLGVWSVIFIGTVTVQTSVLQALGRSKIPPITLGISLLVKIAVNYTLTGMRSIQIFGLEIGMNIRGAVIGSLVCYALAALVNQIIINRILRTRMPPRLFWRPAAAAAVMGMAVYLVFNSVEEVLLMYMGAYWANLASVIATVIIAVLLYFYMLCRTRAITYEDLAQAPFIGRRLPTLMRINAFNRLFPNKKRAKKNRYPKA